MSVCEGVALCSSESSNEACSTLISAINTTDINHNSSMKSANYTWESSTTVKPSRCDVCNYLPLIPPGAEKRVEAAKQQQK